MAYIDTSVLVAYYCPETLSEVAEKVIVSVGEPAISSLTEVELVSALGRKVREKMLSSEDANRVLNEFQSHLNEMLFKRLPIDRQHYRRAFSWLVQFTMPIRTLDALHMAVASGYDLEIITADKHLSQSARKLGLRVKLL